MAEMKFIDKVKAFFYQFWWIAPAAIVLLAYCVIRMKKRNVKLFGR